MAENKRLLGMAMDFGMGNVPADERLGYIAEAGFDATFCGWGPNSDLAATADLSRIVADHSTSLNGNSLGIVLSAVDINTRSEERRVGKECSG